MIVQTSRLIQRFLLLYFCVRFGCRTHPMLLRVTYSCSRLAALLSKLMEFLQELGVVVLLLGLPRVADPKKQVDDDDDDAAAAAAAATGCSYHCCCCYCFEEFELLVCSLPRDVKMMVVEQLVAGSAALLLLLLLLLPSPRTAGGGDGEVGWKGESLGRSEAAGESSGDVHHLHHFEVGKSVVARC